jgi:hypothetical protein
MSDLTGLESSEEIMVMLAAADATKSPYINY